MNYEYFQRNRQEHEQFFKVRYSLFVNFQLYKTIIFSFKAGCIFPTVLQFDFNPLKAKRTCYIMTQCVPRSKHSPLPL